MKSYLYRILMLFVLNSAAQTIKEDTAIDLEKQIQLIEQSVVDFIVKFDKYSATIHISKDKHIKEFDAKYRHVDTILKQGYFIGVIGYSSDYDNDIENFNLGLQRAEKLKEFLAKRYQLNDGNIRVTSMGNPTKETIPSNDITIRFFNNYTSFLDIQDRDKDGVADRNDRCPEIKGISENDGCPSPETIRRKRTEIKKKQLLAEAKTIDYSKLPKQIIKDLPLKDFDNAPTFIKTYHLETVCSEGAEEALNDVSSLYQNFTAQKFFSQKTLQKIQQKIKTAVIPYVEVSGFSSGIHFYSKMVKTSPVFMPKLKGEIIDTLHIHTYKKTFGYLPYKKKRLQSPFIIEGMGLRSFIQQTNHIYLKFSNSIGKKVNISGKINDKKIYLSYQFINHKWKLLNSKIVSIKRPK